MNLWVKRTGQFLIAALFLMACEDENSLLGFRNPNKKFGVNFVDIPLESSVLLIDTVRTDNQQSGTARLLVGRYNDPVFGEVSATSFAQLRPDRYDTIPTTSVYDSLVLELQLDFYALGSSGITQESFSVHEITEDSISYTAPPTPYYYYDDLDYGPSMGDATYTLDYDSLKKQADLTTPDTTFSVTMTLNEDTDFSTRLFDLIKNNPDNAFKDPKKFRYAIKGLALAPASPGSSIIGYNLLSSSKTKLTLHYHTPTDTLTRTFTLDAASFNNITTQRIGDLSDQQSYKSFEPASGMRYLQNGSPVITRLDLTNFYDHMVDIPNTIINAADLVIESVETPGVYTPPASLFIRTMNDTAFYNRKTADERNLMAYYWLLNDSDYYIVRSDVSSSTQAVASSLSYRDGGYNGNLTLFVQSLFANKDSESKLKYLGLYSSNIGKSVNRVVFNQNKVKLRIYYTVPTTQ